MPRRSYTVTRSWNGRSQHVRELRGVAQLHKRHGGWGRARHTKKRGNKRERARQEATGGAHLSTSSSAGRGYFSRRAYFVWPSVSQLPSRGTCRSFARSRTLFFVSWFSNCASRVGRAAGVFFSPPIESLRPPSPTLAPAPTHQHNVTHNKVNRETAVECLEASTPISTRTSQHKHPRAHT